jgi:hypothetical protein
VIEGEPQMTVSARLAELGIDLPDVPTPAGANTGLDAAADAARRFEQQ